MFSAGMTTYYVWKKGWFEKLDNRNQTNSPTDKMLFNHENIGLLTSSDRHSWTFSRLKFTLLPT